MCAEHNNISTHCTIDTRTCHKLDSSSVNSNDLLFCHVQTRSVSSCIAHGKCPPPKTRWEWKEQQSPSDLFEQEDKTTEKRKRNSSFAFIFINLFLLSSFHYWVVSHIMGEEQDPHYSHLSQMNHSPIIHWYHWWQLQLRAAYEGANRHAWAHTTYVSSKHLNHKPTFRMKPQSCCCRGDAELVRLTPHRSREVILCHGDAEQHVLNKAWGQVKFLLAFCSCASK